MVLRKDLPSVAIRCWAALLDTTLGMSCIHCKS
eukprot:CAMPEP_0115190558 /NCGR_PEP_ID=MMETSP0270-20121206/12086_1 /TAXON_ID=71861 /ORGANISM="Scrippsiella trochoidea, Strain CCMP3099" /LENGTH=32 /DNA_ID= /DNA_START= /DNA_END= /DNA_ORIENTATION=